MVLAHIVNYDPATETYLLPKHRHIAATGSIWSLFVPFLSMAFFGVAKCFKKDGPSGKTKYNGVSPNLAHLDNFLKKEKFILNFW